MAAALKPRWSFRAPTDTKLAAFLDAQHDGGATPEFSYPEIGASRHDARQPLGYELDHNRVQIGAGTTDFQAACAAVRAWRMFPARGRVSPRQMRPFRSGKSWRCRRTRSGYGG
jgi:hypothetical protein